MQFDSSGNPIGSAGTPGVPIGLAIDPATGDLYVDIEGSYIYRFGSKEGVFASGLSGGKGLTIDSNHDVYVDEGDQIIELDPSGKQVGVPIGSGHLSNSTSVAVDAAGNVYAGDPYHSSVALFGPSEPDPSPATDNPVVVDSVDSAGARHTAEFQVTPNGEFAVFSSTLPLTGFESAGYEEIYRYDAASESEPLTCVSCDPTGNEPSAGSELAANGLSLTNDGRVFFTSAEALVERDGISRKNVYEWEAKGVGPQAALCQTAGGCIDLITTGTSPFDSSLLGASANGTDAYFFTRDKLVPQDENGDLVRIYDARELGGFEYAPPPIPCKASDECHGPSSSVPPPPNIHVNTGTSGNEGLPANKCRTGFVEKHSKCVKPHPKHHKKHHRKTTHHKRGGKK